MKGYDVNDDHYEKTYIRLGKSLEVPYALSPFESEIFNT